MMADRTQQLIDKHRNNLVERCNELDARKRARFNHQVGNSSETGRTDHESQDPAQE